MKAVERSTVGGWRLLRLFRERREVVDESRVVLVNCPNVPTLLAQVVVHDRAYPTKGRNACDETARRTKIN